MALTGEFIIDMVVGPNRLFLTRRASYVLESDWFIKTELAVSVTAFTCVEP